MIGARLELGEERAASLEIRGPGIERALEVAVEIFELVGRHGMDARVEIGRVSSWSKLEQPSISLSLPTMDHIDFDRLKTGEVNLGVCTLQIVPFDADSPRPRSWLSNSTEASLSAQTVGQPQEATSYALIPDPSLPLND